jgi:hypothetical protein
MKNFKKIIAILLALLALPMCFLACDEGGDEVTTIDPNDTTDGLRVDIDILDGEGIYFIKTGANFRIDPETTLENAVKALCEDRQATYTLNTLDAFASFTYDGATIKEESKEVDGGMFVDISFKVTVNGTEVDNIKECILNHNDKVVIALVSSEPFKPE